MTDDIPLEAARRVAKMTGLSSQQRQAKTKEIEADLRAEAAEAAKAKAAAAIAAEAAQERARIAGVIKAGADLGRPRQAARLALAGPLDAVGAKAVLNTLPADANAAPEALAIPGTTGSFGSPAAVTERRRIGAILGHPEAADRFATASALALETTLDLSAAVAALMAAPRQAAKRYPSLAERSREAGEFGALAGGADPMTRSERIDNAWKKAIHEANVSIGAVPAAPEARPAPLNPSMTADEALRSAVGLAGGALADLGRG